MPSLRGEERARRRGEVDGERVERGTSPAQER